MELLRLGGDTGGQQQTTWRSLEQDGVDTTQPKHGQYNELLSVHSLCMKELYEGFDWHMWEKKQKCGAECACTNTHRPARSFDNSVMQKKSVLC